MCGRFYIESDDTPEELIEIINRAETRIRQADPAFRLPMGEVRPGDWAAVVSLNRASQRSAFPMKWGFRMDKQLLINARSETAARKPTFRESMSARRCLIPASSYFEWDHRTKPLTKYRFSLPDSPLLWLAGLYRFEPDSAWPVFTVLTRPAAEDLAPFHDRMPVIVPPALTDRWLDRSQSPMDVLDAAQTALIWSRS